MIKSICNCPQTLAHIEELTSKNQGMIVQYQQAVNLIEALKKENHKNYLVIKAIAVMIDSMLDTLDAEKLKYKPRRDKNQTENIEYGRMFVIRAAIEIDRYPNFTTKKD